MRAGFYIRRRPQYHPALDHVGLAIPPPSFSAAGFYRGTGVEGGVSRVEGGFLHPALDPPPSYTAAQLQRGGFHRGTGVEGGGFAG